MVVKMMSVSLGEQVRPIAADDTPRYELPSADAPGDSAQNTSPPAGFRALIIGAGISGLCAAAELAKAGIPYVIRRAAGRSGRGLFATAAIRVPLAMCRAIFIHSRLRSMTGLDFSQAVGKSIRIWTASPTISGYSRDTSGSAWKSPRLVTTQAPSIDEAECRRHQAITKTLRANLVVQLRPGRSSWPRIPQMCRAWKDSEDRASIPPATRMQGSSWPGAM